MEHVAAAMVASHLIGMMGCVRKGKGGSRGQDEADGPELWRNSLGGAGAPLQSPSSMKQSRIG